jgi:hypothetical protein
MTSRAEVIMSYARSFKAADKRTKGRILDEVVSVNGWSRDDARRRLTSAAQSPPGARRPVAAPDGDRQLNSSLHSIADTRIRTSGGLCGCGITVRQIVAGLGAA